MNTQERELREQYVIDVDGLKKIFGNLVEKGFHLLGPKVEDNAIVYDSISSIDDLPLNWSDDQGPGYYRIQKSGDGRFFNFTAGPNSWKQFLHPPRRRLWKAEKTDGSFRVMPQDTDARSYAFIGVRPCDIQAILIQDRVFCGTHYKDKHYDDTRKRAFILAVNCSRANHTCFCTSMNSGPTATHGHDLALTEFLSKGDHGFLVEIGSDRGMEILEGVVVSKPDPDQLFICQKQHEETCMQINRKMDTHGLPELLKNNATHPRWQETAERCLSCANCTLVCPTCFCTTVEDTTDLTGDHAERWQRWDSCFTLDFSYVAGGNIRTSTKSRYRQWMTHKLATWHDQFATTGCVGCGRCITWCPVGIDITEEVSAIRNNPLTSDKSPHHGNTE